MNNEELKKKIAKIIDTTEKPCNCLTVSECLAKTGCKYHNRNDGTTCFSYARAEALIAAGLCDKNTLDEKYQTLMAAGFVQLASLRLDLEKVLHRAEVAEKALDLCETAYILSLNHRATEGISGQAIASDLGVHKFFMEQAENELAEEKNG